MTNVANIGRHCESVYRDRQLSDCSFTANKTAERFKVIVIFCINRRQFTGKRLYERNFYGVDIAPIKIKIYVVKIF